MNAFQTFIASHPFGFVTESDLPVLVSIHRLCPCIIRLGNGRLTAPAQDVAHIIEMIEASGLCPSPISKMALMTNAAAITGTRWTSTTS